MRHDLEEWNTCHKVFRPVNDFGINLIGGITITVQRGTVDEGTFTEFKKPHAEKYLEVRGERLAHSFDTFSHPAPRFAKYATPEFPEDDAIYAPGKEAFRNIDLLNRDISQDFGQMFGYNVLSSVESELGMKYPFGTGYHFRFQPTWNQTQARTALRELFASPFFDDARMIQVSMLYDAHEWAFADVAVRFTLEVTTHGFIFPAWSFRSTTTDISPVCVVAFNVLALAFAVQGVVEVWKGVRYYSAGNFVKLYLHDTWNVMSWLNFFMFIVFYFRYYRVHYYAPEVNKGIQSDALAAANKYGGPGCEDVNIAYVAAQVQLKVVGSYFAQLGVFFMITTFRTFK